jgi:DNA-directed RNA polymerase specialized sigma24 family protein
VRGDEAPSAELGVSPEEARHVANLLRYAISLNTAVGLVRAERRLSSSTYRAVELAALILEGKTLEEAAQEAANAWTGSLEEDHRRALDLLKTQREALMQAMSGHLTPEQLAQYMEVNADEFLELVRPRTASSRETKLPEG